MARYLIVAHQTAASEELLAKVRELVANEPDSAFVLLVPATRVVNLLTFVEGEGREVARRTAESAKARLEQVGATVTRVEVGDESPVLAIADEMREHPDAYDAIVVSTFPLGVSRWLGLDLPRQAKKKSGLPVIQVVCEPTSAETARR